MTEYPTLHIGFAVPGDQHSHLRPCLGPGRGHPFSRLARYVDLFHLTSTLHRPLKPEIASLYANQVEPNPHFLFTAALGHRFTYDRDLSTESINRWKPGLLALLRARRLAALTMHFPWSFRFGGENRDFLIRLRRAFHEFPLAAEFRNESWHSEEAISTLIDYHVSFINLDQPAYFRATPPSALLTSGAAVVLLHGRSSPEVFNSFNRDAQPAPYRYSTAELEDWVPRIRRLAANASRTLVIFDNRHAPHAMSNALQSSEMLGARRLLAPADLIERYPCELASFRANRPVQPMLIPAYMPDSAVA